MKKIPGLGYIKNYISDEEQALLVKNIEEEEWLTTMRRRVQHFGYKYDYKSRSIDQSMFLNTLPTWSDKICDRLLSDGLVKQRPDQIIVNEYEPGQGIASHIDCEPCFNDVIVSMSLLSGCVMELTNRYNRQEKYEILLMPKSLLVLSGAARYQWLHGIPARKSDDRNGVRVARSRRISLTFRKVII